MGHQIRGDEREIERGLEFNLLSLLGRGARQDAGARALERAAEANKKGSR